MSHTWRRDLKQGVNISHTGQHPDDLNTIRKRQVENQIVAHGETAQVWQKLIPAGADVGELGEGLTPFLDPIKQLVGSVRVFLGDVLPNLIKVGFRLWAFENLRHQG